MDWGREPVLRARLDAAGFAAVRVERTNLPCHVDSGPAMTRFLLGRSLTHHAAAAAVGEPADDMLHAVEQLAAPGGGPVRVAADYPVVTATVDGVANR